MYLVFDTETTGLPLNYRAPLDDFSNWPRLVQLAYNIYDSQGNLWESNNYLIKPEGFLIPQEATKIHRISQERAEKEGLKLRFVLEKFLKDIGQIDYLVAHNIDFDQKIMGSELLRENLPNPLPDLNKIDTMKSSVNYCQIDNGRGSYKWPSLMELYKLLFKKEFSDAHDALFDVQACAECFFELKKKGIILL